METTNNRKTLCLGIFLFLLFVASMWGLQNYFSPDAIAERHRRITDKYMSQFTSATLLQVDSAYRYIYADNSIYKFSPKDKQAINILSFGDTIVCDNGQTIKGSIHNVFFIDESKILLQIKDKETYQYIGYRKNGSATKFSVEYITDSPEDPIIQNKYIQINKPGTFKEGGEYIHRVIYKYFSTSTSLKHEIYSKETNELLGDERYLDYSFRQKEKLRKAEEARQEEIRKAEEAKREAIRKAEEAKRIEFNNKIANAQSVESVLDEFKKNEPAAQKKYYGKKAVYKGITTRIVSNRENNNGGLDDMLEALNALEDIMYGIINNEGPNSSRYNKYYKYQIYLDSPLFDVIHFYSSDENVLNISTKKQIVFEGYVSSFSNDFGATLCFGDVTILQYQK